MAKPGLMVAADENGQVALLFNTPRGQVRLEMTWIDAVDVAYTMQAVAMVACSAVGAEEAVWEEVSDRAEAKARESLGDLVEEDEDEGPA